MPKKNLLFFVAIQIEINCNIVNLSHNPNQTKEYKRAKEGEKKIKNEFPIKCCSISWLVFDCYEVVCEIMTMMTLNA